MGQCHIITVYEDGISTAGEPMHELSEELGRAVIDLCMSPMEEWTESGLKRVTDAKLGNHSNCINWVDDVHSSEERVYVFTGNRLRPLSKLSPEEKELVKTLIDEQL